MRPNLITRLKEEWNNLDPVDPLRGLIADAIDALAEKPAQQQEPVAPKCGAIIEVFGKDWRLEYLCLPVGRHKLYTQQYTYTAPQPSKPWVGLSTVELDEIDAPIRERGHATVAEIYRAIEAKLREKNA